MNQILIRARELIADPYHWLQGEYAQDVCGQGLDPWDDDVSCMCLVGAVDRAAVELGIVTKPDDCDDLRFEHVETAEPVQEAIQALQDALGPSGLVSDFNDDPHTLHEDVITLLDRAIEASK